MEVVLVAFSILDDGKKAPPLFQWVDCYMIFAVKLVGFCWKARLVAGGHQKQTPASVLNYANLVSSETVCIAFTLATPNTLQVKQVMYGVDN